MRRWWRLTGAAVAVALLLAGCARLAEDEEKLREAIQESGGFPYAFTYREVAEDRAFSVEGSVADDLRYSLRLSGGEGPLFDMAAVDDALAVRILSPAVIDAVEVFLHPEVAQDLRSGVWVVDAAGAPPLVRPLDDEDDQDAPPDPIEVSARLLRYVRSLLPQAILVWEFDERSIDYRPSRDPFRYPSPGRDEARYDFIPASLPTEEEQLQEEGGDVSEAHFRRTVAFVEGNRLSAICQMVDVESHEEIRRMRERGIRNPFLQETIDRVLAGETLRPIRQRLVQATVSYPGSIEIDLPGESVPAQLEDFLVGLRQAMRFGNLIARGTQAAPRDCLRDEWVELVEWREVPVAPPSGLVPGPGGAGEPQ